MSATVRTLARQYMPVRRIGARPGSVHAAYWGDSAWQTACGERLTDSARGIIWPVPLHEAWQMIDASSPALCRRCGRAGDAIGGTE